MREDSIPTLIQELGIRPSFSFDADAIAFVEGRDDSLVYKVWADKFPFSGVVDFLDCEGWTTLHYFANAKVAQSKRLKTLVFVIFDGDTERDAKRQTIKDRLIKELQVNPEQILTLDMNELEGYLLDPKAIKNAFREITLTETQLEGRLAPYRARRDQKKALDDLLQEFKIGRLSGELGAHIARNMEVLPAGVERLFQTINDIIARQQGNH